MQDNWWMTGDMFVEWVRDVFLPTTEEKRRCSKLALVMDNFSGHVPLEGQRLLVENKVLPLYFPPHATHILQPLDVGIIKPFKTYKNKATHS